MQRHTQCGHWGGQRLGGPRLGDHSSSDVLPSAWARKQRRGGSLARRAPLGLVVAATAALGGFVTMRAAAEVPVTRTVKELPASNGHGAILLDLEKARVTQFREHLFATEEPVVDANLNDVWANGQPASVHTRDLAFDAYFGLRANGAQAWLTSDPVDRDASGYAAYAPGARGGTGIAVLIQKRGDLEVTQYFYCPAGLERASFAMVARVKNVGAVPASSVQLFSLHNFHLGFGRPGVRQDIGENGETASFLASTGALAERGFAGVVVAHPLGQVAHHAASYAAAPVDQNLYERVGKGGALDLADLNGEAPTHDGTITGFQLALGDVAAGGEAWGGVVFAHHGDPFAGPMLAAEVAAWVGGRGPKDVVSAEISGWNVFQSGLTLPSALTTEDETLVRQSAAMLAMAQVRESHAYLREWLASDFEVRNTRFGAALDGPVAALPARVAHRGHGAVLASLPPGEWTVSWIRDGAYAASAMATLGMHAQAKDALAFYLGAEAGRFQGYRELAAYAMPPYQISLVRYLGFGVEETDFNEFGPNLELDGFGLFLWALANYTRESGDVAFAKERWAEVSETVADVIVKLVDPATGLMRRDSSIWETHWNGRERAWTYTNVTAARGLCDAAVLAEAAGDLERASSYRAAGIALRAAIARKLTDADGALASNAEELAGQRGYADAAVLDALAMGLFDPQGRIHKATLAHLDSLRVPAGAGWARNDDRFDHQGAEDLSPWGSEYDSGEWVIVDLRGSVAVRLGGDVERSDRLADWVRDQALANYLEIGEVFDEGNGRYKFNSPMIGFGAGAYVLAMAARSAAADPACGAYFDEGTGGAGGAGGAGGGAGAGAGDEPSGCACVVAGDGPHQRDRYAGLALFAATVVAWRARRRA